MSKRAACKSANQQLDTAVSSSPISPPIRGIDSPEATPPRWEGDDQCAVLHADGRVHAVAELVADPCTTVLVSVPSLSSYFSPGSFTPSETSEWENADTTRPSSGTGCAGNESYHR